MCSDTSLRLNCILKRALLRYVSTLPVKISRQGHFEQLARLLDLEAAAEARRLAEQASRETGDEAERSGLCLVKLAIRDVEAAFGGRVIVTLAKRDQTQDLPWNRLGVGTPVLLTEEGVAR